MILDIPHASPELQIARLCVEAEFARLNSKVTPASLGHSKGSHTVISKSSKVPPDNVESVTADHHNIMEAAAADQNPSTQHATRGNRGARRSGRARRGNRQNNAAPQTSSAEASGNESQRTPRGRGRGQAPRRPTPRRTVNGRQFGGQLTHNDEDVEAQSTVSHLQPTAPEFKPGQAQSSLPSKGHGARAPKRRGSRSTAKDLPSRIHEDIDNSQYECAICTNEVQRNSRIWSCKTCWTVFHLSCIKKWATAKKEEQQQQRQSGDDTSSSQWRCPGCNLPQHVTPKTFTCWCEKESDPRSLPGLPPFSCGQTCSREQQLPRCPHRCQELCHAGPCPPCPNMGPTQICFCGRETITKRCIDTDYERGWSCGAVCGELMPCGEHYCDRPCHEGLCGACEELVDAKCYCGKVTKQMFCCDQGEEKRSYLDSTHSQQELQESGSTDPWIGTFDCKQVCGRPYDCGSHTCESICHSLDATTPHCPRSPDIITHCPCGKTPLHEITPGSVRTSCEDPIPSCDKLCLNTLACGHECQQVCHTGDCLPCMQIVKINCRCGRTTSSTICHQGSEEPPQCMRICRATLNCGRHQCDERCCSGEKKASERLSKKKSRGLNVSQRPVHEDFEAEHICTRQCGRNLKCGNHECQDLCHRGPCGSCREAIFDDISCHCGRTVLQSPLPCGTKPPPCRYECERPKACGHPQVPHNCHMDDESCPKCPFLTIKSCLCGKHQMKNQPCWLTEVRCGEICGMKLKSCGVHNCRKQCHRPRDCEDVGGHCQQQCGRDKSCGHPDSAPCHWPRPCKEDKQCQHKIFITCTCQRIKKEVSCNATKHTRGNQDRGLDCDDECGRLERNRRLALALNIDPETHKDDHIPYSAETLNMFLSNVQWAQAQEKELRLLAADAEHKRLRFKPMPSTQRAFLHSLAEDFGFDSESMDPEPHRHVAIFKTPRFVMAPMKTLADCARIRHSQRLASAAAAADTQKKVKVSNVEADPYNGYLITNARFGLTVEELRLAIKPVLAGAPELQLDISWLPNEDIVLKATSWRESDVDKTLSELKGPMARQINANAYGSLQLCRLDGSLNVLRRETDSAANGGWSQVAAKAAAPMRAPVQAPVGTKSSFTVLSSASTKKKKKAAEPAESVVDDWEAAETMEEEREKEVAAASGNSD